MKAYAAIHFTPLGRRIPSRSSEDGGSGGSASGGSGAADLPPGVLVGGTGGMGGIGGTGVGDRPGEPADPGPAGGGGVAPAHADGMTEGETATVAPTAAAPYLEGSIDSTSLFTSLACWYRRCGSFSSVRRTTSSSLTSTWTFCDGGANLPSGSSPVSIS